MEIISSMQVQDRAGCVTRIRTRYAGLTGKEKVVADYILDSRLIVRQTITQVVKASGASYGSVDRLCKKLGYLGFQDLKIHLAEDLARREVHRSPEQPQDFLTRASATARQDIESTLEMLTAERVDRAARALVSASFILVAGLSSSAGTALGIDYRLGRFGLRSACAVDNHIQRHRAATLGKGDVAFLLSFSGSTKEILATARIARRSGAGIIALSNYLESPLSEVADVLLVTAIESDPLAAEVPSRVALEFVVTVLFDRVRQLLKGSRSQLRRTFEATADRQL